MEILDMVLDSIKGALGYSAEATQKIRGDFLKIHQDLNSFGDHIKAMMANVAKNLKDPQDKLT